MPYKDKNLAKLYAIKWYYRTRQKRIEYQRKYDKKNRERIKIRDRASNRLKKKNKIRVIQNYSRKHYFDKLLKEYNHCQLCNSSHLLQIHHIRYTIKKKDCMLLCQECHKKIHLKRKPSI